MRPIWFVFFSIEKRSNLCTEIVEYSSKDEVAVCNLASLSLPAFIKPGKREYDFELLHKKTKIVTRNLNRVSNKNEIFSPLLQR